MGPILLTLPDGSSGDQLRNLRDWLSHESEMRGRIGLVESEPVPGTLGSGIIEALTVGVGSGGAISVLVSGLVSWVRQLAGQRREPVPAEVTVKFPDGGSIKIVTAVAQAWTPAELRDQIDHLAGLMSAGLDASEVSGSATDAG
ncbi:MAG TPA: hypothetical protein VMU95_31850 [Trebonia sp.]|nr:hypothetical protein [Trebonia sp.]